MSRVKYRYPYAYRKRNQAIYRAKIANKKIRITPLDICVKKELIQESEIRC